MASRGHDTGGIPDRGPSVFAVTTATLCLSFTLVAARLFCRIGIVHRVSWDDYFIVAAWLIAFALSLTIDMGTMYGLGKHDVDIEPGHWDPLRKCQYVFSVLYNPALMATKTSILIFYLRLSKNTQKLLRLASWIVLAIVNLAGVVLTFINILQCKPVDAAWDMAEVPARCIPLLTEFICSAPVNIVTDLAILALPLPVLTGMRLPPRQKVILVMTFSLGVFVTVVDVVRIYYLQQAISNTPTGTSTDPDAIFGDNAEFAWNASLSLMWSAVEVNVGITCACIPTLKPLITRVLPVMLMDPHGTRTCTASQTEKDPSDGDPAAPGWQGSSNDNTPVTMADFLTTPDMARTKSSSQENVTAIRQDRRTTMMTSSAPGGSRDNALYFGFVNMKRPKSILRCTPGDSFKYCTTVTILFFMWGVSYGFLNTLNNEVASVANMSTAQTLGLTSAYFGGGYLFGPLLVGEWVLRHDEHRRSTKHQRLGTEGAKGGFKATFMVGLCIYGIGTICFWPSAVMSSFGGFMVCNFAVGFGLAVLETAANPFIALCGPVEYSEMRLLLAQAVQAVGSVLSGTLAEKVFFSRVGRAGSTATALIDVQWTYLAITLFCAALSLFLYYMPLPEVNDEELEDAARRLPVDPKKRSFFGLSIAKWSLVFAVLAQYMYVAAQESMSIFFRNLLTSVAPTGTVAGPDAVTSVSNNSSATTSSDDDQPLGLNLSIPNYLLIAHTLFALSRFLAAYAVYIHVSRPSMCRVWRWLTSPASVLMTSAVLTILCAILTVVISPSDPNHLAILAILFFFAEGPLWPLIFAIGLRGQGKGTKRAAAWITMGASGPAFWPFVMYAIIQGGGRVQLAFVVVVALLLGTLAYPVFLAFVKDARHMVDPLGSKAPSYGHDPEYDASEEGFDSFHLNQFMTSRDRGAGETPGQKGCGGKWQKTKELLRQNSHQRSRNTSTSSPVAEHHEETNLVNHPRESGN